MSSIRGNAVGLADWARRDPWCDRMAAMIERHLLPACEDNGLSIEDLPDVIGPLAMSTLDCAFEDCCTTVWEDGTNMASDYLKRRGWKETAINRAYIAALRDSVMSLYELSDVRPGESFLARDLVRGGDPVRVIEHTATKTLVDWDIIAARIVTVRGKVQLTSSVLAVERNLAETLLEVLKRSVDRAQREIAKALKAAPSETRAQLKAELDDMDALLRTAASTITTVWLDDTIRRCRAPMPELANTDGDPLEFITLHYRILPGISAERISAVLSQLPDVSGEAGSGSWTLLAPEAQPSRAKGRKEADDPDGGRTVHAHLSLEGMVLKLLVNSETRARRVRSVIDPALEGLVQEPLLERVTPEQALAQRQAAGVSSPPGMPEEMDPEVLSAAVQTMLDRQYLKTLGEPLPMLGGKTPRQAARSAKGRKAVANWLKTLEQANARRPADDPMRGYDFSWMWQELGVADLRV